MSGHRATREDLDDDHAAATARAEIIVIGGIGGFGWRLWDGEQPARAMLSTQEALANRP